MLFWLLLQLRTNLTDGMSGAPLSTTRTQQPPPTPSVNNNQTLTSDAERIPESEDEDDDKSSQHPAASTPSTPATTLEAVSKQGTHNMSLEVLAMRGVLFVGDSTTRRMYVQALAQLEGIVDEKVAESLQNDLKLLSKEQRQQLDALNLTALSAGSKARSEGGEEGEGGGLISSYYSGSGDQAGQYSLQYVIEEDLSYGWLSKLSGWSGKTVYYGVPFLHALYHPEWNTTICNPQFDMHQAVSTVLESLQQTAAQLGLTILVGTANTYSSFEDAANSKAILHPEQLPEDRRTECESCWHEARCEEFSQTIAGMAAANNMLAATIAQFDKLQLVRMDSVTKGQSVDQYIGGGHYKGPVLDQKLHAMLATQINSD